MTPQYRRLIKDFPLVPIRDDLHHEQATSIIDVLIKEPLDTGGEGYLDVLTTLVSIYEEKYAPETNPIDVLRELMRMHELNQKELAKRIGVSDATISFLLSGKQNFSVKMMRKLAKYFAIKPEVFL